MIQDLGSNSLLKIETARTLRIVIWREDIVFKRGIDYIQMKGRFVHHGARNSDINFLSKLFSLNTLGRKVRSARDAEPVSQAIVAAS
jgi:hypothetical protein